MAAIIGIIAALTRLGLSLVITQLWAGAMTALQLTGLSLESTAFQARSAFTGTGFTTLEAEKIVGHTL